MNGNFSFNFKLTPFKLKSNKLSVDEVCYLGTDNPGGFGFEFLVAIIDGIFESMTVFSLFFILFTPKIPNSILLEFWSRGFTLFFFYYYSYAIFAPKKFK